LTLISSYVQYAAHDLRRFHIFDFCSIEWIMDYGAVHSAAEMVPKVAHAAHLSECYAMRRSLFLFPFLSRERYEAPDKTRCWTCFISQAQQSRELTEINGRAPPY
jgi:hypothetical protein